MSERAKPGHFEGPAIIERSRNRTRDDTNTDECAVCFYAYAELPGLLRNTVPMMLGDELRRLAMRYGTKL